MIFSLEFYTLFNIKYEGRIRYFLICSVLKCLFFKEVVRVYKLRKRNKSREVKYFLIEEYLGVSGIFGTNCRRFRLE